MKEILKWITENQELISTILRLVLALGAYLYAGIIHWKSKVKINALEAHKEAEQELLKQIEELRKAYERSK